MASSSLPHGQISSDKSEDSEQRRREGDHDKAGNPVRSVSWRSSREEEEETEVRYGDIHAENSEQRKVNEEWWRRLPLLKATLRGDWEAAERIFEQDRSALTATISETRDTALHVAVGSLGIECIHFVEKLVDLMPADALAARNSDGCTPLHIAAYVGNTKAAKILVHKHPPLLYINNGYKTINGEMLPIHLAALHARRDTLLYLLDVTGNDQGAFNGEYGATILKSLISSNFYGE
ncbi:hypothetical protein Vadar_027708 [Vaccinium darrowii]|uniref:Uncharacterized protein n=1 Tax=Vaccinium darrowii TaxID=229202 RepID=A0ACB7YHL9_9ERIC|nr:hypothetical protein Vadar_027708 [Vaccinium darrowii]